MTAQPQPEHDQREDGRDVRACGLDPVAGEYAPERLRLGHLIQPELLQLRIQSGIGIGEALWKSGHCHGDDGDTERKQRGEPCAEAAAEHGRHRSYCQANSRNCTDRELRDRVGVAMRREPATGRHGRNERGKAAGGKTHSEAGRLGGLGTIAQQIGCRRGHPGNGDIG